VPPFRPAPAGERGVREFFFLLFTADTHFTSTRFIDTLNLPGVAHRRTAYPHPKGNIYIERFHRNLKEEAMWTGEYCSVHETHESLARWIHEHNHDRRRRGVGNRTPREAFLRFAEVLKNETLTV
jgi:transposase InsO family protein